MEKLIHVLMIEDDEDDFLIASRLLDSAAPNSFQLERRDCLREGLSAIGPETEVVLLDLSLPDSQGWETFVRVREHAPHIPVILLTGLDDEQLAAKAVHGGAQDFLVKGQFDGRLLSRAIRYAIERKTTEERMEDRYEIRGKIGQGGLGAVYRGFDKRMGREVAIKRIPPAGDDLELQQESMRQLIKEAGALAALQHPHIVTVYDVGSDQDGPFVVMELISGKTLDELIERAPLTWADFRELAMQTQEALIAAQELNLIHSDLKPSNLMLNWLPSGKFQVKIVDFGLATLAQSQTQQNLDSLESVFGSIFFMPPEQFERVPLDARSDMYSMGCVYYQALTGVYPFDGKTGNEVMQSHLDHTVNPLQETRAGIPVWACEWIMWHLNRLPQDRPESARDALSVFLQNDRSSNPVMSTGIPKPVLGPPRPRLRIPGGTPGAVAPGTQANAQGLVQTAQASRPGNDGGPITQSIPQPLAPPAGFKPSVHDSLQEFTANSPTQALATAGAVPDPSSAIRTQQGAKAAKPKPIPHHISHKAKLVITVISGIMVLISSVFLWKLISHKREIQGIADMLVLAESPDTTVVKLDASKLRLLLESLLAKGTDVKLPSVGKALILAQATDGTDVDLSIAEFATKRTDLSLGAREMLIGKVLRTRNQAVILPRMMEFTVASDKPTLVVCALLAVRQMADDAQFETFLNLITTTSNLDIRTTVEINMEEILKKSRNPDGLIKQLKSAQESTIKPEIQKPLKRLLHLSQTIKPQAR